MPDLTAAYAAVGDSTAVALVNGDRANNERSLRTAIQSLERNGSRHLELESAVLKLAALQQETGNNGEAEALFRKALEIGERALGSDDPGLLPALTGLGTALMLRGAVEDAQSLLARALSLSESHLGEDHPDLVILLSDLARLCLKQSAYQFAEPLLLRLLAIKESKGADHPEVATVLASLASVRQSLGRHESAEQLWRRVLEIRERTLAPNHFALATALEHLAEACSARGKLAEALPLYQRAQTIRALTLGVDHTSLRVSRERVADLQLQAAEYPLDSISTDAHAPVASGLTLLSAEPRSGFVPAPSSADTSAVTRGWRTTPVLEPEPATETSTAHDLTIPTSETSRIDAGGAEADANPASYAEIILSMREELEPAEEGKSLRDRMAPIVGEVVPFLRKWHKALEVGAVATGLLIVALTTVTRARGEIDPATAAAELPAGGSPAISGASSTPIPSRAALTSARLASPVVSTPGPRTLTPAEKPRSSERKPSERTSAPSRVSIPSVPIAMNVNLDSVVRAVGASTAAVEPVSIGSAPGAVSTRSWSWNLGEGEAAATTALQPRLIGTVPPLRYPDGLASIEGEVRIRFNIDARGKPMMSSLDVIASPNAELTAAVRNVIARMRFEPPRSGATSVEVGYRFVQDKR